MTTPYYGNNMTKITDFEPHAVKPVLKGGLISVGRHHTGKVAHVYFLKKHEQHEDDEKDEELNTEELEQG